MSVHPPASPPEPPILYVYSRNIEVLLIKHDLNYQELSEKLGVSYASLNRVKSNTAKFIDPEILRALMKHFNLRPNDLLEPQPGVNYSFKW